MINYFNDYVHKNCKIIFKYTMIRTQDFNHILNDRTKLKLKN